MKQVILINILLSLLIFSCSTASVEYLPAVVYLKAPEIINIDGNDKTYIEFAVSDLNELEGSVDINITDSNGSSILEKKINKQFFSSEGSIISFYEENLSLSGKFNIEFKVCDVEDLCRTQNFKDIELNTASETSKVDIEGQLVSENDNFDISIFLSSITGAIIPDKDTGVFEIKDIDANKYNLYTKGDDLNSGFYRYIYLKLISFKKSTKIYLYIPLEENEEYDAPLIDCSFSSKDSSYIFFIFLIIIFISRLRIKEKKRY